MIFLLLSVFLGIKIVSYCRRCGKEADERPEDITFADVKNKCWFKSLIVLRLILFVVFAILGYYWAIVLPRRESWANEAVESWDEHFNRFGEHHHLVNITIHLDPSCKSAFKPSIVENFEMVVNYSYGFSNKCLNNLSLSQPAIDALVNKTKKVSKYPTIVTASSEHDFNTTLGFMENVQEVLGESKFKTKLNSKLHHASKLHVVLYDFGLTDEQKHAVKDFTFLQIVKFPFNKISNCIRGCHKRSKMQVKTNESKTEKFEKYLKPAVIQLALQNHDFILWTDSNVRFSDSFTLKNMMKEVKGTSFQIPVGTNNRTIGDQVHGNFYEMIGEESCLFRHQTLFDTSVLLVRRSNFTLTAIMKPWVSATFRYAQFLNAQKRLRKMQLKKQQKGGAIFPVIELKDMHMEDIDSSVLSVILTRLFNSKQDIFLLDTDEDGIINDKIDSAANEVVYSY